jgi:hypothetical protein
MNTAAAIITIARCMAREAIKAEMLAVASLGHCPPATSVRRLRAIWRSTGQSYAPRQSLCLRTIGDTF